MAAAADNNNNNNNTRCVWTDEETTRRLDLGHQTPNKHGCHVGWKQRLMYEVHPASLCPHLAKNCTTSCHFATDQLQMFAQHTQFILHLAKVSENLQPSSWKTSCGRSEFATHLKTKALPAISIQRFDSRTLRLSRTRRDTGVRQARHEITRFCNDRALGILAGPNTASSHH